jgi:hypothetical protein
MVTPEGPSKNKVLTFVLLRYNNISLARRDSYKDPLRVYGIRGGIANKIDGVFSYILLSFPTNYSRAIV